MSEKLARQFNPRLAPAAIGGAGCARSLGQFS
jgi:hypothetical protein